MPRDLLCLYPCASRQALLLEPATNQAAAVPEQRATRQTPAAPDLERDHPFSSTPLHFPMTGAATSNREPAIRATTSPWKAAFASITSVLLDPESSSIRRLAGAVEARVRSEQSPAPAPVWVTSAPSPASLVSHPNTNLAGPVFSLL
ncbi:hypothetical protein ZWY2020_059789 [Hordeum vulgare]|nr:hypothetical protein ZWY2020_028483 [Hordeum vulgare]KAI4992671.1 hypothetical protein ZWY2020_059789 [Hordeum vulgare]